MSKLFDQLKNAARSREEKPSPGILVEALQRHQQNADSAPEGSPAPVAPGAATPQRPGAQSRISPYSGVGLAILIFAIALFAWHSSPFRLPDKHRIDPGALKLDRKLDVDRITPKGTSPGERPS